MAVENNKIKVLVVDDSLFFRTAIANGLSSNPNLKVVGVAASAFEARDKINELNPDVMTLDVEMPQMNGIEFLKILMPQKPMPVVVVSAVNGIVFEAFKAGAVDFVVKPSSAKPDNMGGFYNDLASKILIAASAKLKSGRPEAVRPAAPRMLGAIKNTNGLIALGASTGGTEATSTILKALPATIPGMVVTQHMPPVFTKMYAQRLDKECVLSVKEAENNDIVLPGHVYIAPGDQQMTVEKKGTSMVIRCFTGEKVSGHCPSVDVLFNSVSGFANEHTVGIILTGMGSDGAKGLLAMRQKGAYTIGQDEKSCVVYGMPMVAYKVGAVAKQVSLDRVADTLLDYLAKK
jgi:two-component system chemotaxis response regulator CheB